MYPIKINSSVNIDEESALHIACIENYDKIVEILIANSININMVDRRK